MQIAVLVAPRVVALLIRREDRVKRGAIAGLRLRLRGHARLRRRGVLHGVALPLLLLCAQTFRQVAELLGAAAGPLRALDGDAQTCIRILFVKACRVPEVVPTPVCSQ